MQWFYSNMRPLQPEVSFLRNDRLKGVFTMMV